MSKSNHANIYWPGTNIPVSQGNAFTSWKTNPKSKIVKGSLTKQMQTNGIAMGTGKDRLTTRNSFIIYSKA